MIVQRSLRSICLGALLLLLGGCTNESSSKPADPPVRAVNSPLVARPTAPAKQAPAEYWVKLETTKGDILIDVHRNWSPYGADRFYELVANHFYDGCRVFRVVPIAVQIGINGDPQRNAEWKDKYIPDDHFKPRDPARQSNTRGFVTFAKSQVPDSRTTQFFFNLIDNARLDAMGFTPFGKVLDGMAAVDSFFGGYQEEPQTYADRIEAEGNKYLDAAFPKLDSIKTATILTKKPDVPKR